MLMCYLQFIDCTSYIIYVLCTYLRFLFGNVRHPVNLLAQDRPNNEFALQLFCQYSRTRLASSAPTLSGDGSASASQGTRSLDCCHTCHISDMRGTKASVVAIYIMTVCIYGDVPPSSQVQVSANGVTERGLYPLWNVLSAGFETDMD